MPEEFDFLRTLEAALLDMEDLKDEPLRRHITTDGENGTLEVEFFNERKYSITFERINP